ncbi:hypothetical protein C8F01DRAFT_1145753 [Mycena amicta]|nr:hypothetical protein C8F01DRAFT_1145753 [Mycena amicta]
MGPWGDNAMILLGEMVSVAAALLSIDWTTGTSAADSSAAAAASSRSTVTVSDELSRCPSVVVCLALSTLTLSALATMSTLPDSAGVTMVVSVVGSGLVDAWPSEGRTSRTIHGCDADAVLGFGHIERRSAGEGLSVFRHLQERILREHGGRG